jgi:hypothetical protein
MSLLSSLMVSRLVAAEVRLESVQTSSAVMKQFERCELTVMVSGEIVNPYDPNEVRLEAMLTPSQGDPVTVSGFYYQPFARVGDGGSGAVQPAGEPVWKVRFTPQRLGRWSVEVRLITPSGIQRLAADPFVVVHAAHRGFVRFDRAQGNFWFDTGEPFIPIGENLGWGPSANPLAAYTRWFRTLRQQHANYIRVWMAPWMLRLETPHTGVGRYDQSRAWLLDELLAQSEAEGLFWQLCLLNHGSFSRSQDPDWQNNPYNEQLGGMCRQPNDFLTHPRAQEMFQRLLRYIVSRWGEHPQLAVWELINEADYGEFRTEDLIPWLGETSRFLRTMDRHERPITTSFHKRAPEAAWRLPEMDLVQVHVYDEREVAATVAQHVRHLRQTTQKPVFIGEFGWIDPVMRRFDDIGIHLHDGLWSSLMSGAGGAALIWYWDEYVEVNRLERHFRPLAAFWRGEQVGLSQRPLEVSVADPALAALGIGTSQRGYLWITNRQHTLDRYIAYRTELAKQRQRQTRGVATAPVTYAPPVVRSATVTVSGLEWWGRYRVEWWDPYRGEITARAVSRSRWGAVTIEVPDVQFDLAAKLIKLRWWERG